MSPCSTCDTLRTDADDGDECVNCGQVYADLARRVIYVAPEAVLVVHAPTMSSKRSRGVHVRHINGFRR